jgi:Domain of unknown function (DUF4395)
MYSSDLFRFPNPVNETSARTVAAGVLAMASASVFFDQPWLLFPLTYGFAAWVATGPTLSPLGQLSTRVITPRLNVDHRYTPGPPKRLAQGVGLTLSSTATVLHYRYGRKRAAHRVLAALMVAAALESIFGLCLACKAFPVLMRFGVIPESVCEECAAIWSRPAPGPS